MFVIVGNCQSRSIALALGLMFPGEKIEIRGVDRSLADLGGNDVLLIQGPYVEQCTKGLSPATRVLTWPSIVFGGYHPDIIVIPKVPSPVGGWTSSIALAAFKQGLDQAQAVSLFRPDVFDSLGFLTRHATEAKTLTRWLDDIGYPGEALVSRWVAGGPFMYGINHPTEAVALDVARIITKQLGGRFDEDRIRRYWIDILKWSGAWSIYPGVSEALGLGKGDYQFKSASDNPASFGRIYDLEGMVAESYRIFQGIPADKLVHFRLDQPAYQNLRDKLRAPARPGRQSASPYANLPDHQFWKRAVAQPARAEVDPVVSAKFTIAPTDRVATAGSCFAQHIARTLVRSGFNYFVAEPAPAGLTKAEADDRQYGLFSARFGNLYTVRQLVQLFDRAHGAFTPQDTAWSRPDGNRADPFRPTVEPEGFASDAALLADRERHLAAVRDMFARLDVFVFTLGLTEGWRARRDGAVLPLAPGVSGGSFDPEAYEFHNFTVDEVKADLQAFWTRLRKVNPAARMILTVSPVPLIATYEPRHALVSTVYSKAVLRAAVEDICRSEPDVAYFPSFEIITGNHAGNSYFEADLRSVREEGVAHVMGLFLRHYTTAGAVVPAPRPAAPPAAVNATGADIVDAEAAMNARIICDEERIAPV